MNSVCVYCGSNDGADPAFKAAASKVGGLLAERSLGLVYGGARNGLMGALADSALAGGGNVVGVIPTALVAWEQAHTELTEQVVVNSMHERKQQMADRAGGFLALPGGIGTLEEIFEMISWAQLGVHFKPCALLNVNGFYDGLLAFLDHATSQGLIREKTRQLLLVDDDPKRLIDRMLAYRSTVKRGWNSSPPQ